MLDNACEVAESGPPRGKAVAADVRDGVTWPWSARPVRVLRVNERAGDVDDCDLLFPVGRAEHRNGEKAAVGGEGRSGPVHRPGRAHADLAVGMIGCHREVDVLCDT